MKHGRIVLLVQKVGPYHHARFREAARVEAFDVVEFRSDDTVYSWSIVEEQGEYRRHRATAHTLASVLASLKPRAVVCVGYSDPEIHRAMAWAFGRNVPLVTCADSTVLDEPRVWWKERFKARVIAGFDAALSAGARSASYLQSLGMSPERIFSAWDVVDNDHFAKGAAAARHDAKRERIRLNLPENYFLCVARFVPKKNLSRMIEAYSNYVSRAGDDAWSLVLSGSGPLEDELRSQVNACGLRERVTFAGFLQYDNLPACYGLAEAFVLPSLSDQWGLVVNEAMASGLPVLVSERCGCAPDLVDSGENGFVFSPEDPRMLAEALWKMASLPASLRARMGRRSLERISALGLSQFSSGLWASVRAAVASRRPRENSSLRPVISLLWRMRYWRNAIRARKSSAT
jgi:glycosyltransferase involved in cell wall biosynthesis